MVSNESPTTAPVEDGGLPPTAAVLIRFAGFPLLVKILLLGICYLIAAKAALLLAIPPGYATAVWPPSGIALAALLLYGLRLWPGVWIGAVVANGMIAQSFAALVIATGNTLEAVAAAWLLRRVFVEVAEFRHPDTAFRFAATAALTSVIGATLGIFALRIAGHLVGGEMLANWYTWWQGDTTGMIVVTPLLLAWLNRAERHASPAWGELLVFVALLIATFVGIFLLTGNTRPDISRSLTFLLVPFLAWAGCRFDARVVTTTILAVVGISIWATVNDSGPFRFASQNETLLVLQAFASTVALVGLVLNALTRERSVGNATLVQAQDRLERQVEARTRELATRNRELAADIERNERLNDALREREAQLKEAQAITHIGSWSLDTVTRRMTWSDELYRIYGLKPDAFDGTLQRYYELVHPDDRARIAQEIEHALTERQPWESTERIVRSDGSVRTLRSIGRVLASQRDASATLYGVCVDDTDRLHLERLQAVQMQVTHALLQAPEWRAAGASTLRIIGSTLGWTLGQMWRIDTESARTRYVTSWHDGTLPNIARFVDASATLALQADEGLPGRTLARGTAQWVEDLATDPTSPRAAAARAAGLHAAFTLPLTAGTQILGVLEFFSTNVQSPPPDVLQMLSSLGNQLGEYIVRNEAELKLRESEERFRLLVEGVKDYAIFMLDPYGRVSTWNMGARRIKGYAPEEIIGSHFSRFYVPEDLAEAKPERVLETAQQVGHVEDEGWRIRKDGTRFWANVMITALYDAHGRLRGFAKITRDMTERKKVEALEEARRQSQQFLAMLSHELRNPLAPMRNAVAVMRMHELSDPQISQCREMIERQVTHLARLVDDLLEASRIATGKFSLKKELFDLRSSVTHAIEASRPAIEAKQHRLALSLPNRPLLFEGDPTRLAQVAQNLLNNAIKYTPLGGVIEIELDARDHEVLLTFRDNGIGIPDEMLKEVFELFIQADRGLDRAEGGLGIGLTLVQEIVALHGGRVHAESDGPGRGATFIVSLPNTAPIALADSTASDRDSKRPATQTLRVLVVDDNRDAADSMSMLLELSGHEVRVAYDGESALAVARDYLPQVVLLDIGLPDMDGYAVAKALRRTEQTQRAFLIALTGYGQTDDRKRSSEAGFDEHLVKPVDIEVLNEVLQRHARS